MRTIFVNIISATASIAITGLAVAVSAPAAAAPIDNTSRVIVQTSDLDLQSAGGQDVAMRRIHKAVAAVCSDTASDLIRSATCRDEVTASATQSLRSLSKPTRIASR